MFQDEREGCTQHPNAVGISLIPRFDRSTVKRGTLWNVQEKVRGHVPDEITIAISIWLDPCYRERFSMLRALSWRGRSACVESY